MINWSSRFCCCCLVFFYYWHTHQNWADIVEGKLMSSEQKGVQRHPPPRPRPPRSCSDGHCMMWAVEWLQAKSYISPLPLHLPLRVLPTSEARSLRCLVTYLDSQSQESQERVKERCLKRQMALKGKCKWVWGHFWLRYEELCQRYDTV